MASRLEVGRGSALWRYWTAGEGLARWVGNPHPWTALRAALVKEGVPGRMVDGLTTNIFHAVTGTYPQHGDSHNGHPSAVDKLAAHISARGR